MTLHRDFDRPILSRYCDILAEEIWQDKKHALYIRHQILQDEPPDVRQMGAFDLDVLVIGMRVEKEFGIEIGDESEELLHPVSTLNLIKRKLDEQG